MTLGDDKRTNMVNKDPKKKKYKDRFYMIDRKISYRIESFEINHVIWRESFNEDLL